MTDLDPRYIAARQVLLDVLIALKPHLHAVIVVGAHAVYLRTGDAGVAMAPFTNDAISASPMLPGPRVFDDDAAAR